MSKIFYDHLVKFEEIVVDLDRYELEEIERAEIIGLADEVFQHRILALILDYLSPEQQSAFLGHFHQCPYDQVILKYLKKEVKTDIEEAIKEQSQKIKKEILSEIKKSICK